MTKAILSSVSAIFLFVSYICGMSWTDCVSIVSEAAFLVQTTLDPDLWFDFSRLGGAAKGRRLHGKVDELRCGSIVYSIIIICYLKDRKQCSDQICSNEVKII